MATSRPEAARAAQAGARGRASRALAFFALTAAWWALDRATKAVVDAHAPGALIASGVCGGLFDVRLVHNTGAAWGVLSNSTTALGFFGVLVAAAVAVWVVWRGGRAAWPEVLSLALVCGGALGNAYDRIVSGRVVDFISCAFVDFPVFNVADIGVTAGVALFCVWAVAHEARVERFERESDGKDDGGPESGGGRS